MQLVIGNKNYSSWSLRAWLCLRESQQEFEEIRIPLFTDSDWKERIKRFSPAGRVPVLLDGDTTVWDSLAIMEYVNETRPNAIGWPLDPAARAHARSIAAEMHSGFLALRDELPQNIRASRPLDTARLSEQCRNDVERVDTIWTQYRNTYHKEGPWLFGRMSIADVMFAPVAMRFRTYSIDVSDVSAEFVEQIAALEAMKSWIADSKQEHEKLAFIDDLASDSPLVFG